MSRFEDRIYEYVELSPLAKRIVDTCEYQKMHSLKQLSIVFKVFPSANHTRFEHSIGVYHLAGEYIRHLQKHCEISARLKEIIQIAGLLHDL